jgi:membrane protease YdiL (CAAX protease family)
MCGVTGQRVGLLTAAYVLMVALAMAMGWATWTLPMRHPAPWLQLGEAAWRISLGLGALVGIITVVSTRWLLMRAAWARALRSELRILVAGASHTQLVLLGVSSGIAEELFFRGAIQPLAGLTVTSFVFGFAHVGPRREFLPWTLWALVMGFVLGGLYEMTGMIEGPILAHAMINTINLRVIARHDAALGDGREPPSTQRLVTRVRRQ